LVLIFGWRPFPALGETGSALATVVSSGVMAACFAARRGFLLGWLRLPSREVLTSARRVGLPAGAQGLLHVFAFLSMSLALAHAGAEHLAASEIVLHLVSVSFLPGVGVGEAGGVLVGRYLGANKPET